MAKRPFLRHADIGKRLVNRSAPLFQQVCHPRQSIRQKSGQRVQLGRIAPCEGEVEWIIFEPDLRQTGAPEVGKRASSLVSNLIELARRTIAFFFAAGLAQQAFGREPLHRAIDRAHRNVGPERHMLPLRLQPQPVAVHGSQFGEGREDEQADGRHIALTRVI